MLTSPKLIKNIYVTRAPLGLKHKGLLRFNGTSIPCSLGKNGISTNKKEGDQTTPAGSYPLLFGFFRADRIKNISSPLPICQIKQTSGWCDDVNNPNYNQFVTLPHKANHETLMREDRLYDICLAMDHNYTNKIRNRGSAVFFHLTNLENGPTQGCIAIEPQWMMQLLPRINQQTTIHILP